MIGTIETVDFYLTRKYLAREMTLEDVARQLCKHGWTNYVDKDYALTVINRTKAKIYDRQKNNTY